MRIILALLSGLVGGFLISHLMAKLIPQTRFRWPVLSLAGGAIVFLGIIILASGGLLAPHDTGGQILIGSFALGGGIGALFYQLLYFGFLWQESREEAFVKRHQGKFLRFFEIVPGAITWLVITSPVWLSLKLPFFVAYLILLADLYWFLKSVQISVLVFIGYGKMKRAEQTGWLTKLADDFSKEWTGIRHLVVIPTYKENSYVLETTFAALANSDFPKHRIYIALGIEERDQANGLNISQKLITKYGRVFGGVWVTVHPYGLPGEVPGPATNRNFALRNAIEELHKKHLPDHDVLVTTLDADFVVSPNFLSGATYAYLACPKNERDKRSFTGVFFYNNNYWQAAAPMRIMATGTAFWQLSEMVWSDKYINFASLTINLSTLIDLDFWIPDRINDDAGFYWKAYYHLNGDYKVIPHYLPISADAVQDVSFVKSLQNQYLQLKRWAYGVEHIPFVVQKYFEHKQIPFWDKTSKLLFVFWIYVKWGTLIFLVTFGALIIPLVSPEFRQSAVSYNLPLLSSWLLTAAFLGLFSTAYISEKVVPQRPKNWNKLQHLLSYLQWLLLPLTLITIASIPALDAQTRLMLGKYMEFRVTTKVRKEPDIIV